MTQFVIADIFTASLSRSTDDEQMAAKVTALDLQLDPASAVSSSSFRSSRCPDGRNKGLSDVHAPTAVRTARVARGRWRPTRISSMSCTGVAPNFASLRASSAV